MGRDYHFLYGGTVYGYRIGFDPVPSSSVAPGLVTIGQSLEWAFANGRRRFDFLVSGDGSSKERHPGHTETVIDLARHNHTLAGQVMRFVRQAQGGTPRDAARLRGPDRDPDRVRIAAPASAAARVPQPEAKRHGRGRGAVGGLVS